MKRFLSLVLMIAAFLSLNATDWIELKNEGQASENIKLVSSDVNTSMVHFSMNGFWKNDVETSRGTAWLISAENSGSNLKLGAPNLPVFATSLIIPNQANMQMKIVSSQYEEFQDVLIAPSKGNLVRTVDPSSIPYEFGKQYSVDLYYPGEVGNLREPYIVRDFRAQTVLIYPMQYNPISKTLRVYYDITVEITESGTSTINTLPSDYQIDQVESTFHNIYSRQLLNYNLTSRYDPVGEVGNMLIISHGDFMDEVQPLIDWKIKTGTPVEIVDVATIGGASDIKQYIANYFTDNGLTFVLLVGDAPQVPTSNAGGWDSDVDYSYVAGNDHYPDLFVGRFSAETEAQVVTQVTRVLDYEQNPITDTAWYSKAVGIASDQGPGDDNEYDYVHIRNIGDNKLIPFTYNYAYEFFDGSQGGNDADNNPTSTMVGDAINSGATIINYTGHGSQVSWSTSGFSNSNVNSLTNNGKLPFIFSVACVNGNFVAGTCFAEAWLRAENNGEPAGAIATLMSTINQSWNPPMRGQDEMNDILSEAYSDNIKRTFGGISMNGCMNMNDVYGTAGEEMTDTWTIFGDPSLEIRTAVPQDLTVTHPASVILGSTTMSITCDAEGAFATFSMNGEIIGSAIVEGGSATLTYEGLTNLGTADFVVTSFNYRPYISTIEIIPAEGPYIVYATNIINDIAGNNDGLMDYSENILLTVGLTNVGLEEAVGVTATLTTTSEYIELVSTEADYGNIAANDTVIVVDGFEFNVTDDIPDLIIANFQISAQDENGNEIWESSFMLTGHAPSLVFSGFAIDDSDGNSNGRIDPGETVEIAVDISNDGTSEAYNVMSELQSSSEYIEINGDPQSLGNIPGNEIEQVIFSVSAASDTPEGTSVTFEINMIADHGISGTDDFIAVIGLKSILIIDLANSNSTSSIESCLDMLQVERDVVIDWSADINNYQSVFVLLGIYPDNYVLENAEGDLLATYLENGGRIYMEGGDTWAYDNQTSVHELFNIEGIADGAGDLGTIVGESGSIMHSFEFEYNGINSYIDQIAPKSNSLLIFKNTEPEYGTGVSFENEVYKTIGTSFEFAGLVDQEGSTKDEVMAEILFFFGINYMWTDIDDNPITDLNVIAYPNPTNENVTIQLSLDKSYEVSLSIFDLTGRKITDLSNEEKIIGGSHNYYWNTTGVDSGIYFYKLNIGSTSVVRKIIVTK
ncbi:MAG: hypothetical protein CL661_08430 [Bacteroidetes bacterium]|nr:hypothetical protein [Bacteroidota bacterium]